MVKIETVSGILYCHREDIHSVYSNLGRYYLITNCGRYTQKWEITETAFINVRSRVL